MNNYEKDLDKVDKLTLKGRFQTAERFVKDNYLPLFDPIEFSNLMALIETNRYKV